MRRGRYPGASRMDFLKKTIDVFLHLDRYLNTWAGDLGSSVSRLLFAVIFCETGLVVTPFLPSDSLLFAVDATPPTRPRRSTSAWSAS